MGQTISLGVLKIEFHMQPLPWQRNHELIQALHIPYSKLEQLTKIHSKYTCNYSNIEIQVSHNRNFPF